MSAILTAREMDSGRQNGRSREITPDVSRGASPFSGDDPAPVEKPAHVGTLLPTHTERLASVDAVTTRAATVGLARLVADVHCGYGYPFVEIPAAYHELVERIVADAIEGLLSSLAVPTLEAWRGRSE